MTYNNNLQFSKPRNFGVLTNISKDVNYNLGDNTNRTVSMRTAHGFKNTFNIQKIEDDSAEDFAHLLMLILVALPYRKNDTAIIFGLLIFLFLLIFYANGRFNKEPK